MSGPRLETSSPTHGSRRSRSPSSISPSQIAGCEPIPKLHGRSSPAPVPRSGSPQAQTPSALPSSTSPPGPGSQTLVDSRVAPPISLRPRQTEPASAAARDQAESPGYTKWSRSARRSRSEPAAGHAKPSTHPMASTPARTARHNAEHISVARRPSGPWRSSRMLGFDRSGCLERAVAFAAKRGEVASRRWHAVCEPLDFYRCAASSCGSVRRCSQAAFRPTCSRA